MRGFVRASWHLTMSLDDYLDLPRLERSILHRELDDWIDIVNEANMPADGGD